MKTISSKRTFDFSVLSSYRLELMGLAALWIILNHTYKLDLSALPNTSTIIRLFCAVISSLKPAGNIGVDIFLIFSGLGLYYSFSKNSNLSSFYKKRAIRILPALFMVTSIYYAFKCVSIKEYLASVFLIDYFTKCNTSFWYFALVILLYILYPVIHKFVKSQRDIVVIGSTILLIILELILTYVIKLDLETRYYALLRVPTFIIGVWLGKKSLEKSQLKLSWVIVSFAVSVVSFILVTAFHFNILPKDFSNAIYIYCFINIPFSVSFVIVTSVILSCFKLRFVKAFLSVFGALSLELYLLFERVTETFENVSSLQSNTFITFYFATTVITIILSVVLQTVCKNITSTFTKEYKKLK